jgi:hypothetical protein
MPKTKEKEPTWERIQYNFFFTKLQSMIICEHKQLNLICRETEEATIQPIRCPQQNNHALFSPNQSQYIPKFFGNSATEAINGSMWIEASSWYHVKIRDINQGKDKDG